MNKHNDQTTVPRNNPGTGLRFNPKRVLKPQALFFGLLLIYCLLMFIDAMQAKENSFVFSKWNFVWTLMVGPLLLLITSVLILVHRLSTTTVAIALAGYLIYVTAYRGLISAPNSHGVPVLGLDALKIWFKATPNDLILQAAFATAAFIFGTVQLLRLLRKKRSSVIKQ